MSETPMSWAGRVAIANIGLDGRAILGATWKRHHKRLLRQFTDMLNYGNVCGLCLCEVGSFDYPLTEEVRSRVHNLIEEAFEDSGASAHGHAPLCGHRARAMARPSQRGAETCTSNRWASCVASISCRRTEWRHA